MRLGVVIRDSFVNTKQRNIFQILQLCKRASFFFFLTFCMSKKPRFSWANDDHMLSAFGAYIRGVLEEQSNLSGFHNIPPFWSLRHYRTENGEITQRNAYTQHMSDNERCLLWSSRSENLASEIY